MMNPAHFLKLALEQAKLGRGNCAPNPSVGAVAVQGNTLLATGFHAGPGQPHAEVVVLSKLVKNLPDVTLYVTLEPCNHWGRTPPCVDAIIQYGVKRVIYAYTDLNPVVVEHDTPAYLRRVGIEVLYCPQPEIDAFYESYAYWCRTQLPWVTVKLAQSLDGKIAKENHVRVHLSNDACAAFTHEQRQYSDCILTTAETVIADDPALTVRLNGQESGKCIAVLDSALRVKPNAQFFQQAKHCLIYHTSKPQIMMEEVEYIALSSQGGRFVLMDVLRDLGQRGIHDVWVEAGATLFSALHLEGLVQRTYLYITPHILGQAALTPYYDEGIFQRRHSVSWRFFNDNAVLVLNWQDISCLQG